MHFSRCWSDDVRGNYLAHKPREHMEYIVFGKWLRSETDRLGTYGTYPIALIDLLRVLVTGRFVAVEVSRVIEGTQRHSLHAAIPPIARTRENAREDGSNKTNVHHTLTRRDSISTSSQVL